MKENEILDEIHRFRAEHAHECGYDVHRIFQGIRKGTDNLKEEGWKVVSFGEPVENACTLREECLGEGDESTQRAKMRELYARFNGDREKCVKAYAEAERAGQVARKRDEHRLSAENYAGRLYADGIQKKWLY